ncbi:hypothetical protein [Kitasatospora sp. NBC_00315]|uniref:hypothetical protein n=1 Tax=Kitasatospora sp. NBC_00315 TaxID=2975963 RepID=UPI0032508655
MQHAECGDGRLAAEGEVAVARLAIDGGDLPHAADHLADAMASAPQLPELHEALAEFCARAGGPAAALEFFPLDGEVYLGTLACAAHLRAAAGEWSHAVGLLASAIRFAPALPWAQAAWLTREDLPELLSPDDVAQAVARASGGLPDPVAEESRSALLPFEAFVRAVVARHPGHPMLLALASGLTRRLGDTARAVELAERAYRIAPEHMSAVLLGCALRADGRPQEALAVWEKEVARDPGDGYLAVDIAELHAATGRPDLGLPWLERVLAKTPEHPKAGPALHALRHALGGGTAHLLGLTDHLRAEPEHEYAAELLNRLSHREDWLGAVPGATEATVNVLHRFLASPGSDRSSRIDFAASVLEPPSSQLAVQLAFPEARVAYGAVPEPDPRLPVREVGVRVWRYEGSDPRPAVPAPSARAAELVRETAKIVWPSLPAAYDHAVRLSGLSPEDLLGVLVHPPLPREDELGRALLAHQPELWVRAVQSFACLGIAHHRTDQPWPESDRRRILVDLLLGPEDWVAEAAGFALVALAWVHPEDREDIGQRLLERLLAVAEAFRRREVSILRSVCTLVLACPWLDASALDLARGLIAARERELAEQASAQEQQAGPRETAEHAGSRPADDAARPGGAADPAGAAGATAAGATAGGTTAGGTTAGGGVADARPALLRRLFRRG